MTPHHPATSVMKKYSVKYLLTQLRQKSPPIRLWKNITIAPMCWTNSTFCVGASTPQDWQIMQCSSRQTHSVAALAPPLLFQGEKQRWPCAHLTCDSPAARCGI